MAEGRLFEELCRYYQGFSMDEPVGNNAFSFQTRQQKRLYVPKLIQGDLTAVALGDEVVFSEIFEGQERNCRGLRQFVYWRQPEKDIFIFDNHQHAFAFWSFGLMAKKIAPGSILVHVDQHKDLRQPARYLERGFWDNQSLEHICSYVNRELNVGNFVAPALKAGIFREVILIDHEQSFGQDIQGPAIADIDLDIFAPEMRYISLDKKASFIQRLIEGSSFVTIATSPYFMEQGAAVEILNNIFNI